jgi:hypothetical protein
MWSLDEKKIIVACDVIFLLKQSLARLNDNSEFYIEDRWKNNVFDNDVGSEGTQGDLVQEGNDNVDVQNEEDEIIELEVRDIEPMVTRSGRITVMMFLKIIVKLTGRNGEKLLKEELGNKAWEIIDLPERRKPLDSKWIFTVKRNKNLY